MLASCDLGSAPTEAADTAAAYMNGRMAGPSGDRPAPPPPPDPSAAATGARMWRGYPTRFTLATISRSRAPSMPIG